MTSWWACYETIGRFNWQELDIRASRLNNMVVMNDLEREQIRHWAACWKEAGSRLDELRREKLRHTDTQQSLISLAGAFESCRLHHQPLPTSGLVEQQHWFGRLAK
jgi:hypothetical protein